MSQQDADTLAWIKERLLDPPAPTLFKIRHVSGVSDEKGETVHKTSAKVHGGLVDGAAVRIRNELFRYAKTHAKTFTGRQRYKIIAIREKRVIASFSTAFRGNEGTDRNVGESEPATSEGLLTQFMRHNDSSHRIIVESSGDMFEMYERRIKALEAENIELRDDRREWLKRDERQKSEELERDLMIKKHEDESQRTERLYKRGERILMALAGQVSPVAAKMFLGGGISEPAPPTNGAANGATKEASTATVVEGSASDVLCAPCKALIKKELQSVLLAAMQSNPTFIDELDKLPKEAREKIERLADLPSDA